MQIAYQFIHKVRQDRCLQNQVRERNHEIGLEELVRLGSEEGFAFTAEELRLAHKHDWAMRWIRYDPKATLE